MGSAKMDPRKQFSKKLARWTSIFWFAYMAWLSVLFILTPGAAQFAVYMGIIATAVMILNVAAYTRNSVMEKMALAMLDKTKLELSMKTGGGKSSDGGTDSETDSEAGDGGTEEGGNG